MNHQKRSEAMKVFFGTSVSKNDCFKEMQNITILDQSFFDSKKNQSCKKKVFGDKTFHLSKKKILDSGVGSISNKTFFFGVRHKKTKKLTAQNSLCFQYLLTTAVSKK